MTNLKEKLRDIKSKVEAILREYPYARENDFYLYLLFLRKHSPELAKHIQFIPIELIKNAPSMETITRIRRKLQHEGKYLPKNPKVLKRRKLLEQEWRKNINKI